MNELILVADDDRSVREGLKSVLLASGYAVALARNGEECMSRFSELRPALVLLDVMMPKMNGFEVCKAIRRVDAQVPVVILTAMDATEDEVQALSLGADDFISKSAEQVVMLARVRRALGRVAESEGDTNPVLTVGKVAIDLKRSVVTEGARSVRLTRTQADIMRLLLQAPGHILSKDEMVRGLYGCGYACTDGAIYTHIYNLRERLGSAASCIDCQSSVGYRLRVG